MNRSKFREAFMVAAGAYLIYLAYELLKGGVIDGGASGKTWYVSLVCGIVFAAVGIFVIIRSVRNLLRTGDESENAEQYTGAATDSGEEESSGDGTETSAIEEKTVAEENASKLGEGEESAAHKDEQ